MSPERASQSEHPKSRSIIRRRLRLALRAITVQTFSSLTRRIVVLNLAGLVALVVGIFYLNQFREGLIDARVQALLTQGEIMASAVAASATVETGSIRIDPEKLLEQQAAGEEDSDEASSLDFPINPEKVAPLMRRLISPTKLRARVYDRDGNLVIDSRALFIYSDIVRTDLPQPKPEPNLAERVWNTVKRYLFRSDAPLYKELGNQNGKGYPEVITALNGAPSTQVSINEQNESIVSVAVPIQRFKSVLGVLLLSTRPGEIDEIVTAERLAILRVFAVAAVVMVILSILLASTIAGPIRQLARAAERVRYGVKSRQEIPDFTERSDEIGHLSGALRDMTNALFKRIEAIESFAADVAHELKNPLTSLRSAVETLPLARNDTSRNRLLEVIQHDVRRLDRLISDISDASRLDAELLRSGAEPVDLVKLLTALTGVFNSVEREDGVKVRLSMPTGLPPTALFINGHDSRLGQVINNLVDNARSFSPRNGEVRVELRRNKNDVEIAVEDDGPGVPDHAIERIFERFYTDRPEEQGFGQNSGLGLSISKQIIEAHGGKLWVENRKDGDKVLGARFVARLPAAQA
ncbi:sensor histidine kinase [Labrys sp. LIt4]|uniref:histidine kinase n=1 Tax=Labrys okinawensis TaxID=346911 RepID=A0A2S9Q9Y8_9HYPH|nr:MULTISPECIES: sensor histidine kinase [Labrys]MBP0582421.1 sensor histidine kinase [Labrys sp. LIt4]PRH86163.1 histidine kinase [Labrys okinawensis]